MNRLSRLLSVSARPFIFNVAALGFLLLFAVQIPNTIGWDKVTGGGSILFAACLCGFLGNLQHFESFQASLNGFEAKMKEADKVIEDAKATVESLNKLAKLLGCVAIDVQEGAGRLSGNITMLHKQSVKHDLVTRLKDLKLPEHDLDEVLRADQFWKSLDYMMGILHPTGPTNEDLGWRQAFREILNTTDRALTPDECEEFMLRHGIADPNRNALLRSYRHYTETNEHIAPGASV